MENRRVWWGWGSVALISGPAPPSHRAQSPSPAPSLMSAEQPHLVDANNVLHTVTHAPLSNQFCSPMDCQRPRYGHLTRVRPAPTRMPSPPFIFP